MDRAYVTDAGPDVDADGSPDWFVPRLGARGQVMVKYDPSVRFVLPDGRVSTTGRPGCNAQDSSACTCEENRACVDLARYMSFFFQAEDGIRDGTVTGVQTCALPI